MKFIKTFVVVACAVLLSGAAMAQGGGGGRGGGQRMMMGMGMGDSSGIMLLQRPDVQKDLALTDDQKSKLTAMQDKIRDDMRARFQNGGGGRPDRETMQKVMKEVMDNVKKEATKILTKEQVTRLREINIQLAGNGAILWEDVQKDLGLSSDQTAKIKDLQTKQNDANSALRQKAQDQEITFEELQESMKKNNDMMNVELGKILKDDQKAKLKTMGGKEFKPDTNNG